MAVKSQFEWRLAVPLKEPSAARSARDPSPGSSVETRTEGYGIQIIGSYGGSMRDRRLPIMCGTTEFNDALDHYETEGMAPCGN